MSLIKIFNKTLESEKSYKPSSSTFKIKPSVLGSPCLRKVFYESSGVEKDFETDLDGKKRMAFGTALHDMMKKVFTASGTLINYKNPDGTVRKDYSGNDDTEFPISSPELFIKSGKIDLVYIVNGELWLGEIKSINNKGFLTLHGPKSDHLIQGVVYLYIFNQMLQEGKFSHIPQLAGFTKAKGVSFLYACKDPIEFKEFPVGETDEVFKKIVDKILLVKQHYDEQKLPEKTQDYCYSCPYRLKCKNNKIK